MMVLALALAAASSLPTGKEVYQCEHMRSEASKPHTPVQVDLSIERVGSSDAYGVWSVIWPDKAPMSAQAFPALFGSVGGSVGLRWQDENGKKRTAYISFGDVGSQDGSKDAWLSLDHPSLWQPPGYFCVTALTGKEKGAP